MSKIQSESNSQHTDFESEKRGCCDQYVKDTIWKQFTTRRYYIWRQEGCDQYVKDTIWKQFTTEVAKMYQRGTLWPICQRYNLKAIHNDDNPTSVHWQVVTNMSKIQSESNSQPLIYIYISPICCDQYVKDTIWKQFTTLPEFPTNGNALWPICQRYNLKAIHNARKYRAKLWQVVTNMSKIQSESNSQRISRAGSCFLCCDQYVKDTIWKQFTTGKGV